MKLPTYRQAVLGLVVSVIALAGGSSAQAGDKHRDRNDRRGVHYHNYNSHREHRHYNSSSRYYQSREYGTYRGQRGYWENRSGLRIFINL